MEPFIPSTATLLESLFHPLHPQTSNRNFKQHRNFSHDYVVLLQACGNRRAGNKSIPVRKFSYYQFVWKTIIDKVINSNAYLFKLKLGKIIDNTLLQVLLFNYALDMHLIKGATSCRFHSIRKIQGRFTPCWTFRTGRVVLGIQNCQKIKLKCNRKAF